MNKTFKEKLELISKIYFREDNIVSIEKKLDIPECLQLFYMFFGNKTDFFDCMYHIIPIDKLEVNNDIITIAIENQGVCSYGLNVKSQKIMYCTDDYQEEMNLSIEDFIIYLLAMQGTGYLPSVVKTDISSLDIIEKEFIKLSNVEQDYCVYCYGDKIIGFVSGNDIFLSAQDDEYINDLEDRYGLQFDWC